MIPEVVRVTKVSQETGDVHTLFLEKPGFSFDSGQFNMLYVFGKGEVPVSIAGFKDGQIVHTVRSVGKVTDALCRINEGDEVGIRGPFGNGWPKPHSKTVLLVAGGIGLVPLAPTIDYLSQHRRDFERVILIYGARTPGDIIYQQQMARWLANIEIQQTVDVCTSVWSGHVGNVITLIDRLDLDWPQTQVYTCGPEVMMRFVARNVMEKGVLADAIYLSLERNMKCATGHCGHCQFGAMFTCKDGPVFAYPAIERLLKIREL